MKGCNRHTCLILWPDLPHVVASGHLFHLLSLLGSSLRSHAVLVLQEVKSTTVAFLLLKIPTLKIKTVAKKEVFEANLKSECDLWHLMVKEMWAGKKLADDHKV